MINEIEEEPIQILCYFVYTHQDIAQYYCFVSCSVMNEAISLIFRRLD